MRRLVVLASCAATAAALLWPMPPPMRQPASRAQRAGPLFNAVGQWTAMVDEASGQTFYYNEQTGESQWEAPTGMAGESQWEASPQAGGGLDFENYRQFVADSGEFVSEEELTRRFNELDQVAQTTQWQRPKHSYNGAYAYAPQRAALLEEKREKRGDRFKEPTDLQEFLRWQEWYVQYCRVRGIGQ